MSVIKFDTSLSANQFAKTNIAFLIKSEGVCVNISNLKNGNLKREDFSSWSFEGTSEEDGKVFFKGNIDSSSGDSLKSLADSFEKKPAVNLVKVISFAVENDIFLPAVGFGGIYCSENVLVFIPSDIFLSCTATGSECQYKISRGTSYLNGIELEISSKTDTAEKLFSQKKALAFLRSACVYKLLCSDDAFSAETKTERNLDMIYEKFLPLEKAVENIPEKLADSVNAGLRLHPDYRLKSQIRREKKTAASKKALKLISEAINNFPLSEFLSVVENSDFGKKSENPLFLEKQKKFLARQKKIVSVSRFLNRNKNYILTAAAAVLIAVYIAHGFYKTNQKLYTSLGCTPVETAGILYKGISDSDVTIIQEVAKGKQMRDLETMVAGFHVKYKNHEAVTERGGRCTPEKWISMEGKTDFWMFGITNLLLNDNPFDLSQEFPRRKDHKTPLTSENGGGEKGEKRTVRAKYYLLHQDGDYRINIIENEENCTMSWNGKRWIINSIFAEPGKTQTKSVEIKKIRADLAELLEKNNGDLKQAAAELKIKYEWLP